MMFDIVIRAGSVLDGSGRTAYAADIGITGGKVAAVGGLAAARARREIDATGRLVAPGFVDAHVHADARILDADVQLAALRQGITTMILGQDGLSFAPADAATLDWVGGYFAGVNGRHPTLTVPASGWVDVARLLATYRGSTALNTAYLAPHGTIRRVVMGGRDYRPSGAETARMRAMVDRALADGAIGLSSGLGYLPGRYADAAELTELCRPLAARGLPYVTHMRGYEERAAIGMAEAAAIGCGAGIPVHISHYHGPARSLTALLEQARSSGADVSFDSYPYLKGASVLTAVLPEWLPSGDPERLCDVLSDRRIRHRLTVEMGPDRSARVTLAHIPEARFAWAEGLTLPCAAERAGLTVGELCAELLIATRAETAMVFDYPATTTIDDMRTLARDSAHVGGSDGIYIGGHPHPRGYGAFARFLRGQVREWGDWSWADAIEHLSTRPAERFRLPHRGRLAPGYAADVIVIDPNTVADRADYHNPRELAGGIDDVLVAGIPVLRGGALTGVTPGSPLCSN
ncbi:amidohydrolase family protein [Nocardia sp. NPDC088792]|uniref:N-acyl-D-amino-acid deacylase family protein n=1 Tax=Nocardia sp. NPDC088792 TaxID=3364332 RepID=UPI0038231EB6